MKMVQKELKDQSQVIQNYFQGPKVRGLILTKF